MSLHVLHVLQDREGGAVIQTELLAERAVGRGDLATVVAPTRSQRALPRAAGLARLARSADLVHAHGTRAAAWALPALTLRPSVVTFHGLHPMRRPAGPSYRAAARLLVAGVSAAADAVICVSTSEAAELRTLPVRRSKIHLVENAVAARPVPSPDQRAEARHRLELEPDDFAVLFVGRLEEPKDPLLALRVARELALEGAILLVAGDGGL